MCNKYNDEILVSEYGHSSVCMIGSSSGKVCTEIFFQILLFFVVYFLVFFWQMFTFHAPFKMLACGMSAACGSSLYCT